MSTNSPAGAASDGPPTGGAPVAAEPARIRVSDADRARTVAHLQAALGEGRLELDETDERVAAAFAARYDDDLSRLVVDLPPPRPAAVPAPSWDDVWTSAVWRARLLVLGPGVGDHAPTAQHRRTAALLAVLAVAWFLMCAFAGAAMTA